MPQVKRKSVSKTKSSTVSSSSSSLSDSTLASMDVAETEKSVAITLNLADMDEGDIDVSVSGYTLTLSGEKSFDETNKKRGSNVRTKRQGSFTHTYQLPPNSDLDNITATIRRRVLKVTVPKLSGAITRHIKVQRKG